MDWIIRGTAATIAITFYIDGVATDPAPDSATVQVLREDGTVLVATTTAPEGDGNGEFTYTLTPSHTALLDRLTARWTATVGGYAQTLETHVEIVGAHVCSLADIATALNKGGQASSYSSELKQAARTAATEAFEREARVAFTPRYARETLDGNGLTDLLLPTPRVISARAISIADEALTVEELEDVQVTNTGELYRPAGWPSGRRNLAITWEHGYVQPPADVSRAIVLIAAHTLADGPWDDRGYGVTDEGGAVRLLTAGVAGASFSIPEVQATLKRVRYPSVA